jgi:cytoskeletal protein RodZ
MACDQYQEQFTDFLEGTLSDQAWRELELHLQQCEHCAVAIKSFRRTVSALRGLPLAQPPRTLIRALDARLAQEARTAAPAPDPAPLVAVKPVRQPARRRAFSWSTAGALAAACLVVAMVALHSFRPPTAPESAQVAPPSPGTLASAPLSAQQPAPVATSNAILPATSAAAASGNPAASVTNSTPASSPAQTAQPSAAAQSGGTAVRPVKAQRRSAPYVATTFGDKPAPPAPRAVPMDIKVDGSSVHQVGAWQPVAILLKAGGNVDGVTVSLAGDGGLQVSNRTQRVSLRAGQPTRLSAQVRAQQPGTYHLQVKLASDTVSANTTVDVTLPGLAGAPVLATHHAFRSVTLSAAAAAVARDCGMDVEVDAALADRVVSADFSDGVSGSRALRSLARMVGGRLVAVGDGYRIAPK